MNEIAVLWRHAFLGGFLLVGGLSISGIGYAASDASQAPSPPASSSRTAPSAGAKAFDAVAVRPTQFVMSLVSTGVFVISLPFTALDPVIGADTAWENLVETPFEETFQRPLGDLEDTSRLPLDPFSD